MKKMIEAGVRAITAQYPTISEGSIERGIACMRGESDPEHAEALKQKTAAQLIDTTRQTVAAMEARGILHPIELWPGGPKRYLRSEIMGILKNGKGAE